MAHNTHNANGGIMQSISEIRRQNLRHMIDTRGGPTEFSKITGINLSYLVQMTGSNPIRSVTEKTARKCEIALGLPEGTMDTLMPMALNSNAPGAQRTALRATKPGAQLPPSPQADAQGMMSTEQIMSVMQMVIQQGNTEGVTLSLEKGADVIALALADSASHNNTPRPDYIKTLVRLAK